MQESSKTAPHPSRPPCWWAVTAAVQHGPGVAQEAAKTALRLDADLRLNWPRLWRGLAHELASRAVVAFNDAEVPLAWPVRRRAPETLDYARVEILRMVSLVGGTRPEVRDAAGYLSEHIRSVPESWKVIADQQISELVLEVNQLYNAPVAKNVPTQAAKRVSAQVANRMATTSSQAAPKVRASKAPYFPRLKPSLA